MTMSVENPQLQLAHDFVATTDRHIFLTGRAGTGKTTFLHSLVKTTPKRLIVTAPTGVAAINAGGVTLHSFFQLPFGPFLADSNGRLPERMLRISREKKAIINSLDLLVIDEISMVRADLLDAVDAVLRLHRRSNHPFGGVQLLMIGDVHQLPPVVKDEEWQILSPFYESFYFFSSMALKRTDLVTIELQHIYRQSDPEFIQLLNCVRQNEILPEQLREINRRCESDDNAKAWEGAITLCTHNARAEAINERRLAALSNRTGSFPAVIEGNFPEYSYPAPALLELKKNAQVMFVRNDPSPEKCYFNGKIGCISHISSDRITVRCPGDDDDIEVVPITWENIEYTFDAETKEISTNKTGEFRQYPLKLAWAITIHKSQGLTFEKVIIDAQSAFAHGQVYVALSRCKTLEGIRLLSPVTQNSIKTDATVRTFSQSTGRRPPDKTLLAEARRSYEIRLLHECFDFGRLHSLLQRLVKLSRQHGDLLHLTGLDQKLQKVVTQSGAEIFTIAGNFKRQLDTLLANEAKPASSPVIQERTSKASGYFQEKLTTLLITPLAKISVQSDNKEISASATKALELLRQEAAVKCAAVESCITGFSPQAYLKALSSAAIDRAAQPPAKKSAQPQYSEADVQHPELFEQLCQWRAQQADEKQVARYQVMHQRVLIQIAVHLPDNRTDLLKIHGIGKRIAEKYGEALIALVAAYRQKQGIVD